MILFPEYVKDVHGLLTRSGALILNGHFVLSSGVHSAQYVDKTRACARPSVMQQLSEMMANGILNLHEGISGDIDVVIAPATAGIVLSYAVASWLTSKTGREARAIWADKGENGFQIGRGFQQDIAGASVWLVEDVMTSGKSVFQVLQLVRAAGGKVLGVAALCNRGNVRPGAIGSPPQFFSLIDLPLQTWSADECPLCARDVPVNTNLGKGAEFVAQQKQTV